MIGGSGVIVIGILLPICFCSSSGGGTVVKDGGNGLMLPPKGVFVVVVVVVADKDCGTPSCPPPKYQGRKNTGEGGADKAVFRPCGHDAAKGATIGRTRDIWLLSCDSGDGWCCRTILQPSL
ncbi:MAG: hypothetical protein J0L63_08200 [Anaerolineae bacterium]|nr:hypothetical protein [Anaerolineae bacterium]